jgi:hypothetical protein
VFAHRADTVGQQSAALKSFWAAICCLVKIPQLGSASL